MDLSVGQVSGIIAAAIFLIQSLFPNALVVVLACLLNAKHTAVTWSVVQRQLNNSLWPLILRSDTAATRGVEPRTNTLAYLRPIGIALIAIAAIVTPLGLYDDVIPDRELQEVLFTYLTDSGPMGYGTPSQGSDVWFNRECGGFGGGSNCPGGPNEEIITTYEGNFPNSTEPIHTYNITIPQRQYDLYTGGLSKFSKTVAGFFDIKSRQYTWRIDEGKNNDKVFPVNTFRMLNSFILDNKIEAVQGLVIDMVSGGIAFRNHTVPTSINQAAEWTEDLTWMEPLIECVDTNLTLEFTLPTDGSMLSNLYIQNLTLVDNGGFTNLIQEYPALSMDDNQSNPKLKERAYKAAWLVNANSALILNVTQPGFGYLNSELNKKFPLESKYTLAGPDGIAMDLNFQRLVDPSANTITTFNSTFDSNRTITTGLYPNPHGITGANFTDISTLCQGSGQADWANSSNIQVQCGLFFAAASRKDGVESLVLQPGSEWQQSVYTCAALNKVSLKTVRFRYNATLGTELQSLSVVNITDKVYNSEKDMPLWGIEEPASEFRISDIQQFWGMVSDDFDPARSKEENVALKRAPELYLPGYTWGLGLMVSYPGYEYIPAAATPKDILATTFLAGGSSGINQVYDYTGASNLAVNRKWQSLSKDIKDIPRILALIWTDLAANALQGAKGWESSDTPLTMLNSTIVKRDDSQDPSSSSSSSQQDEGVLVPVLIYRRKVRYHWPYAIPAFIMLAMFVLVMVTAVVFSILRSGPSKIKYYLTRLSAGRLLAAQMYPEQCEGDALTGIWIERVGREVVDVDDVFVGEKRREEVEEEGEGGGRVRGSKERVNESMVEVGTAADRRLLADSAGHQ